MQYSNNDGKKYRYDEAGNEIEIPFGYRALRGRIVEKYGTMDHFAKVICLSKNSLSLKMNCKLPFTQKDIIRWCEWLDIDVSEISYYFFN